MGQLPETIQIVDNTNPGDTSIDGFRLTVENALLNELVRRGAVGDVLVKAILASVASSAEDPRCASNAQGRRAWQQGGRWGCLVSANR